MPREAEVHHVETPVRGRFLVERPDGPPPLPTLIGFHGYGESAEDQLGVLRRLAGTRPWLRRAVQGLHAFYRGRTGEVVASWMTRLDRELAIEDNVRYVRRVVSELVSLWSEPPRRVYVGFSQGVAMAYRAATRAGHACHGLVVVGGDVPPELGPDELARLPPVLLARGRQEEWYTQDKMDEDLRRLRAAGAPVEACLFAGGHEWTSEVCGVAAAFLERIRSGG